MTITELIELLRRFPQDAKITWILPTSHGFLINVDGNDYNLDDRNEDLPWLPPNYRNDD